MTVEIRVDSLRMSFDNQPEQSPGIEDELSGAVAIGEETVVADAVEIIQIDPIRDCRILVQSIAKITQVRSGIC